MKKNKLHNILIALVIIAVSVAGLPVSAHASNVLPAQNQEISVPAVVKELTAEEKAIQNFKAEVIRLVNVERQKAGVNPVAALGELDKPADLRALEINVKFSHTRPSGESWNTVFAKFNLEYTRAGENLANGFKTPEAVMKAWMGSPGHKANVLNPDFAHIGIGYYKDAKGKIHLSQLFYTPMPKEVAVQ